MEESKLLQLSEREQAELSITNRQMDLYQSKLNFFGDVIDTAKQGINLVDKAMDVYRESKKIELDKDKIEAYTNIQLAKIAAKYNLCQQALISTFGEREKGLRKYYDVLDKALEYGDREMVIASLQGISSIIVKNPLESYAKMIEAFDNPSATLELDF